jgi:hypothetical protein
MGDGRNFKRKGIVGGLLVLRDGTLKEILKLQSPPFLLFSFMVYEVSCFYCGLRAFLMEL